MCAEILFLHISQEYPGPESSSPSLQECLRPFFEDISSPMTKPKDHYSVSRSRSLWMPPLGHILPCLDNRVPCLGLSHSLWSLDVTPLVFCGDSAFGVGGPVSGKGHIVQGTVGQRKEFGTCHKGVFRRICNRQWKTVPQYGAVLLGVDGGECLVSHDSTSDRGPGSSAPDSLATSSFCKTPNQAQRQRTASVSRSLIGFMETTVQSCVDSRLELG